MGLFPLVDFITKAEPMIGGIRWCFILTLSKCYLLESSLFLCSDEANYIDKNGFFFAQFFSILSICSL